MPFSVEAAPTHCLLGHSWAYYSRSEMQRFTVGEVMGKQAADSMRVTTTLTRQQHVELERLAKRNDVTVA